MLRMQGKPVQICCALCVLLLGLAIRYPKLHQSLWFDEMTTLSDYVQAPWKKVLAADAGEYVPNNHVLHTILVKLIYPSPADPGTTTPPREMLLRLPALIAGLLVPLALAWPFRREYPWMALAVAVVATLNPWLVEESVESRGYTIMLLLGIVATVCLPKERARWPIAYIVCMVLAIYTVPLALLLLPAHGVAMLVLRRGLFARWLMSASLCVICTLVLYMPMMGGMAIYYQHPFAATLTYNQFLDALPRHAMAGAHFPQHPEPVWTAPEPASAAICWVVPVVAIILGSILLWRRAVIRPMLLTLGVATLIGILLPLVTFGASEARFVQWILPWYCLAVAGALMSGEKRWGIAAGTLGLASLMAWQSMMDVKMPANQPIREALAKADELAPPGANVIVLYIGGYEATKLYGGQVEHHRLGWAFTRRQMIEVERLSVSTTGHLPWLVVLFEALAAKRDHPGGEAHGLWQSITTHYHLVCRLPGMKPVAIYAPNEK
jgi:hypothetical protein